MNLSFATSSSAKFAEARQIFPDLTRVDTDLPEIQSADQTEIVTAKLNSAIAQGINCVLVEDTGLELNCLGGLPGPFIKFFLKKLGAEKLFEIANKLGDLRARAITIAACECNGVRTMATGAVSGTLVSPAGSSGFGFDIIFKPDSAIVTYAQMSVEEKSLISHRSLAMRNLRSALQAGCGS